MENKRIILKEKPKGKILESNFSLEEIQLNDIKEHEVLGKTLWLSMDPALFGRLRDDDNYAEKTSVGELMQSYGIAQVIESKSNKFKNGDIFFGNIGMQEYCVMNQDECRKINPYLGKISWNLSLIGLAGVTAYFGLLDVGKPKKGETIVVSAAAGSVGTLVGQIGKIMGCRVVGIVGSDKKVEYLENELGFDAVINYKTTNDLTESLKKACPNGIDVYFDNVAGDLSNALLPVYNNFARIVLCGRMALANLDSANEDVGIRDTTVLLRKRIKKQGFVVLDFEKRYIEAILMLLKWKSDNKIKIQENIVEGLENSPKALLGLLEGNNIGKQLVKISEADFTLIKGGEFMGKFIQSKWFPKSLLSFIIKKIN